MSGFPTGDLHPIYITPMLGTHKPWRANRHEYLNFIPKAIQPRQWAHIKRSPLAVVSLGFSHRLALPVDDLAKVGAGVAGAPHDALGRLAAVGEFEDERTVEIPLSQLAEE